MKVGFTGTRNGMAEAQRAVFAKGLDALTSSCDDELHHGDCTGADAQAHEIAAGIGLWTVGHPPTDPKLRAWCKTRSSFPAKPYLGRNRAIVDGTEILIACPGELAEQIRSGTWSTVRYARRLRRPVVLVFPDGTVKRERC